MKKTIVLILISMLAFGSLSVFAANQKGQTENIIYDTVCFSRRLLQGHFVHGDRIDRIHDSQMCFQGGFAASHAGFHHGKK